MQKNEKFFVSDHLGTPCCAIYGLQPFKFFFWEVEALPFDVYVVRGPADGRFFALGTAVNSVHDPLEYAHVVAESRPHEVAVGIFPEPVHMENAGRPA